MREQRDPEVMPRGEDVVIERFKTKSPMFPGLLRCAKVAEPGERTVLEARSGFEFRRG